MGKCNEERKKVVKSGVASGIVALVFFVLGVQSAVLMVRIGDKGEGGAKQIDTIYISANQHNRVSDTQHNIFHHKDENGERVFSKQGNNNQKFASKKVFTTHTTKKQEELFKFDPNLVTESELIALGFSNREAKSIIQYREKGNKFYCKEDFARLYAVSDSMMRRLESFIVVKQLDINLADSADFTTLRGIGGYYASKIVKYRERLGSFVNIEQLMEIKGIDSERFDQFRKSIHIDNQHIRSFSIWNVSDSFLINNPYIGSLLAERIRKYKELCDSSEWSLEHLAKNNIIPQKNIEMIKLYSSSP